MSKTFASRLREFALTVDNVDNDAFDNLWQLVNSYLEQELNFAYCALLVKNEVDREVGLLTLQSSDGRKPAFSVRSADNRFNGLAAYSFAQGKPLWIVSSEREPLDGNTSIRDLWSGMKELPTHTNADAPVKTAVFVPLCWDGVPIGVLDLQLLDYHEPTKIVKGELKQIAETFSEIHALYRNNRTQRKNTKEAINRLRKSLKEESWPPLTKPRVFIASSGRADEKVMGIVKTTLNSFKDQLRCHYWKESSKSGNINWDILKEIKASRFGICYFSEPVETHGQNKQFYQDNLNVIFEAGMLQSLTNPSPTEHPTGWIPIREAHPKLTPPPPFDFAQQRMIIVERDAENHPNVDKLKADLKAHIENLLNLSTY